MKVEVWRINTCEAHRSSCSGQTRPLTRTQLLLKIEQGLLAHADEALARSGGPLTERLLQMGRFLPRRCDLSVNIVAVFPADPKVRVGAQKPAISLPSSASTPHNFLILRESSRSMLPPSRQLWAQKNS
jgi:hypothetical protein